MTALKQYEAEDVNSILEAVAADGACIAKHVLAPSLCDQLLIDFEPYLGDQQWGVDEIGYRDDFYGHQTKRLHGLFSKSKHMTEVLLHPLFLTLARSMLIDSGLARDIRLSNAELMVLGKDQGNQVFHADAGSWYRVQQAEQGEILISANCALTDFTATNGATRVIPGSHRWPADREPTDEEACLAVMPKGSALIYSGNAIHSGGANQEADTRTGLYLGYIPSWLRPLENQLVTNEAADIQALPDEARRLLDVSPGGITIYA